MTAPLRGRTVVVTGATGLFARPVVSRLLANDNEVVAVARFTDPATRAELEGEGARCIAWDLRDPDLSRLPRSTDYVFHAAAYLPTRRADDATREFASQRAVLDANVHAAGRLLARFREARSFFHCSSGRVYAGDGQTPLREDDPVGMGTAMGDYALSKIAGEELVRFLAEHLGTPVTIARIFALYGPAGGSPTRLIRRVLRNEPIPINPDRPVHQTVMYEDDYVDKAVELAAGQAAGAVVVNFAGSQDTTVEQYCTAAAELAGRTVRFVEDPAAPSPRRADVVRMESIVGPTHVDVDEGVGRVVALELAAARRPER